MEKVHETFIELANKRLTWSAAEVQEYHKALLANGNCIPLALLRALPLEAGAHILAAIFVNSATNKAAERFGGRSYRERCSPCSISMTPRVGVAFKESGTYVVHSDNLSKPHGILVLYDEDTASCKRYHGERMF